jgi:Zn-finger nucleic acid-binding protein
MNCPACNIELKMGDRQGVEINYCPTCRGIWLDRGGLDKIIDRCVDTPGRTRPERYGEHGRDHRHDDYEHDERRRKSFLSNLFD